MKEENQTTEKSIKPRVSKFTIPNDENPTFGTCRVNSRSEKHVSLDSFGFKKFDEIGFKKFDEKGAAGEDLLYGIVKNAPSPNAYFYQSPNAIELYICKDAFQEGKNITFFKSINWKSAKSINLKRPNFIHLENLSLNRKNVEINVIERGSTEVFDFGDFYRITYPLVKISTAFHYNKNIFHFSDEENKSIYDTLRNNCYCGNRQIDPNIQDLIRRPDTIYSKTAYVVHKDTQTVLNPQYLASYNRFVDFNRYANSGVVDADGGLILPSSSETPLTDSNGNKYDDFVAFKYIGKTTKRIFAYHLKKYDYSDSEVSTDEVAEQARMKMKVKPVILQIAAIIFNPNVNIRAAFREALDGGGDPNSIPCP